MGKRGWAGVLAVCLVLCAWPLASADALPSASALVAFAQAQVGSGYIFGAYGQISTANFRHGRAELYPDAAKLIFRWADAWDGMPVYDCIGLFKAFMLQTGVPVSTNEVNTTVAWSEWTQEWGLLEGAVLQPGMALFRVEGSRMQVKHIGVYVGDGVAVHARGTRWGVIREKLPVTFTHWARLSWLVYDTPMDERPAVTEPFLPEGTLAVVNSDNAERITVSAVPFEAGKVQPSIGYFEDGALLLVLEVPNEVSRLVMGTDIKERPLTGYVRLVELREAMP